MPTLNFNAPEEFLGRVKAYQEAQGIDNQSQFIREALEAAMQPKTLMETVSTPVDAEFPGPEKGSPADAAMVILNLLPEHQRNLILDCAMEHGRPPLDFILSYCKLADERGETPSLVSESVIEDEVLPAGLPLAPTQGVVCAYCQTPITAARRGQKYCADPDDGTEGCGRKATLEDLHKRRPQRLGIQHQMAAKAGFGR